jgi:hypothetical protein
VRSEVSLLRVKEHRNILHEISKLKANWIGHFGLHPELHAQPISFFWIPLSEI